MNKNNPVRVELKKIVSQIETLAREAHARLTAGDSILDVANELVKDSITLTFGLGELYATEKDTSNYNTPTTTPKVNRSHNVRDSRGRFARKVRP